MSELRIRPELSQHNSIYLPEGDFVRVFVTLAAHSSSISVGMTQGYSAVLLPQLGSSDSSLNITKEEASWIASLGVISTPFGALLSGILVDVLGRKSAIIITSLPFLVGWLTTAFATDVLLLYVGRTVSGFAAGMTAINYLYVSEVSSKEHRSVLSAFGPILVSFGVLVIYTLGFITTWERTALVSSAFSALIVVAMILVPESPAWYVSKNKHDEAYESLYWLRRDSKATETELKHLISSQDDVRDIKDMSKSGKKISLEKVKDFFKIAKSPEVCKPFTILIFFFIFQIGSGIYIFLFYATHIFREFGTDYDENLITVTIGLFRFLMAILGAVLMAKIQRRSLGIFSGVCMSLSLLVVCVYQFFADSMSSTYQFLPFVSILFHVGFSMTGFLQLPWILNSELFPLHCRGLLSGLVSCFAYFCIFIAVKIYWDLLQILKLDGILWGFFIMSAVGTLFLYFFMPETKDKSLKDISRGFMKKKSKSTDKGNPVGAQGPATISVISNDSLKLNPQTILEPSLETVAV
ncbi:hypothetical protein RUM44_004311 [Polyplax serrata]|uniref:Major facilitator superfamily (MFS) profile domain-containing protein n=1 Tax=Polyplax serrata TaxID=468196 RepID=A0ABR1B2H1_POLSC